VPYGPVHPTLPIHLRYLENVSKIALRIKYYGCKIIVHPSLISLKSSVDGDIIFIYIFNNNKIEEQCSKE
jgi:hypothetical protein